MKLDNKIKSLLFICGLSVTFLMQQSCHVYSFKNISYPDTLKTVKVNFIENHARYVNPVLSPRLTDGIRQKIVRQTRLSQTNNEDAHWEISGEIRDYSLSTSAISDQQVASNRLNISVHITLNKRQQNEIKEYDVSRSFDFSSSLTLQAAEAKLGDEIIRSLTDDIFNQIFSNW